MKITNIFSRKKDLFPKKETSLPQILQKNITEILIMSDYASGMGIEIIDPLPGQISELAYLLIKLDNTLKLQQGQDINIETTIINMDKCIDDLSLAIKVHNQLSKLILPVTAKSLIATQPGIFKHNKIMLISLSSTILSLIILIGNLFFSEIASNIFSNANNLELVDSLLNYTSIVFAAILGSGVYSLYTARNYLIKRTFEPKYNSVYTLRFVLGIALGTILGLFGDDLGINVNTDGADGVGVVDKLGSVVLAIVGGFSSDAVVSILKRIAETLQVVVQGSGDSMVENEIEKATNNEKNKAMKLLLEIKAQVSMNQADSIDSGNIVNIIDKYIAKE